MPFCWTIYQSVHIEGTQEPVRLGDSDDVEGLPIVCGQVYLRNRVALLIQTVSRRPWSGSVRELDQAPRKRTFRTS